MKRVIGLIFIIGMCCMMLLSTPPVYAGEEGIKIGQLVIEAVPGTRQNLIVKSSADIKGLFTDTKGKKEYYIGETGVKLGLNLNIKEGEKIYYTVFSVASEYKTGSYALQGRYFGQRVSVAAKAGAGAALLIGGFKKSFTLQPLALQEVKGWGVDAGLGYLYLQKDPTQ
ncbi:MAG: DUF992 domain-containing protein [Desulfobacteraceae bacterium]